MELVITIHAQSQSRQDPRLILEHIPEGREETNYIQSPASDLEDNKLYQKVGKLKEDSGGHFWCLYVQGQHPKTTTL